MEVTFEKLEGGRACRWTAVRSKRRVTGGFMGVGRGRLPHDLVQFVIEGSLGLTDGFWGSIDQGATFRSTSRRRTQPGRAVIQRNRVGLDAAEVTANVHWQAWRDGAPTPMQAPLDVMATEWSALPDGGSLTLPWSPAASRCR